MDPDYLSTPESDPGSKIDTSVDTISSFIADWVQIKYFYSEAASLAQELCETLLASNAIRAIVTHRVKQGHRLEAKLRERVRKLGREYRSAKEIRDNIVDLAGVRIALYFPSDREKIHKIIHDAFTEVKHKPFPEQDDKRVSDSTSVVTETSPDFQPRFHGYSADHYRVRMRVENLATKKLRDDFQKTNPVIEIQVASVLMHAWAEIDHDLVYKTLTSGPASQQELRLLDATNGLVHTGEVLLQQLQTAMDDRVAYQNKPFSEQYELLSFLRGQIKKAKGSMEHLDVLLLVLKITALDSPRRLGENLEGFMIPPESTDPIALTILEHILSTLSEEQRRNNNLYLRSRSFVVGGLEIDKTNPKYYSTDVTTRDRILNQRDILEMAVCVADILRFPEKSILVVEGMPQKFQKFYTFYNQVHFANVRLDKESTDVEKWLCEISLERLDPLWSWFENNDDILFRVSLLLARMNVEYIDQELIKLRPSSGFQRLPSVYEPNQGYNGYMSPGNMSPGYFTPGSFNQSGSREDEDTESRFSRTPEGSEKSRPTSTARSLRNGQNSPNMPLAIVDNGRKSVIQEEDEEDPSPVVIPERARRSYKESASKPESKERENRPSASLKPMPEERSTESTRRREWRSAAPRSMPEKRSTESTKRPERRSAAPRSMPEKRSAESTKRPEQRSAASRSMPEEKKSGEREEYPGAPDEQYSLACTRTNQNIYVEDDTSDDSDGETEKREVKIHQKERPVYMPSSPPRQRWSNSTSLPAGLPGLKSRSDDDRPDAALRARLEPSKRATIRSHPHHNDAFSPASFRSEAPPLPQHYQYQHPARRRYNQTYGAPLYDSQWNRFARHPGDSSRLEAPRPEPRPWTRREPP